MNTDKSIAGLLERNRSGVGAAMHRRHWARIALAAWFVFAGGAWADEMVLDQQGNWQVVQADDGALKSLYLEKQDGSGRVPLASLEVPVATVTNVYWDEFAAWSQEQGTATGGMVTNVAAVPIDYQFRAFVNEGNVFFEDWAEGVSRLWAVSCALPEERTLLASVPNETDWLESQFCVVPTEGGARWFDPPRDGASQGKALEFDEGEVKSLSASGINAKQRGATSKSSARAWWDDRWQTVTFDGNGGRYIYCSTWNLETGERYRNDRWITNKTLKSEYDIGALYGNRYSGDTNISLFTAFTRPGYGFNGWYTAATGGTEVKETDTVTSSTNRTLYAHWLAPGTMALATAVDSQGLTFTTGGGAKWFGQEQVTHDGVDAARSGPIGHSKSTWMETKVTGPGTIGFWWKVSCTEPEERYTYDKNWNPIGDPKLEYSDKADFLIDGKQKARRAGNGGWEYQSFKIGSGKHTLRWKYQKDTYSDDSGYDCMWVDQVIWEGWQTVTFDANGGVISGSKTTAKEDFKIAEGSTYDFWFTDGFPVPTRSGYGFDGFYTAKTGGSRVIPTSTPVSAARSRSFYARWAKMGGVALSNALDNTDLTFQTGGDAKWAGQTTETHDGADAARSGALNSSKKKTSSWLETSVEGPGSLSFWMKVDGSSLELLVDGEQKDCLEGGVTSTNDWVSKTFTFGSGIHTVRWLYETSSRPVGRDCAWVDQVEWAPKEQTVTFDGNGGTSATGEKTYTVKQTYGTLPNATREDYAFQGWFTEAKGGEQVTGASTVTPKRRRTLYAQWKLLRQTVTFDGNGGTSAAATKKYDLGGVYGELPTATRAGQALVGWYTAKKDGKKITAGTTAVTETPSRTFYAHWTTKQTAKFNANGGKCDTKSKTYTIGKAYGSLPKATKKGFGFVGWTGAAEGGTPVAATSLVTEETSRTLYAQWTTTQTVAFDPNGGECDTAVADAAIGGAYGSLPKATRAGSAFVGWYTAKKDGTKITETSKATEAATRTLYAHWTTKQTANFNANGGKCETKSKTYTIGKAYGSLPKATKKGYGHAGWATAAEGGEDVTAASLVTEETPRTLYAQWTTQQMVSFDPNGGECEPGCAVYEIGKAYGELPVPTREGNAFTGWYTAKKDGKKVTEASTATEAATRTLYARWTAKQTVKFNANGGKCSTSSKAYAIGNAYGSLPTPTWKGHVFTGWSDAKVDGEYVTKADLVTVAATRTLYAQWNVQAVRFNANGGTCRKSTADFALGGTYGELPVPERSAHAFRGWWTAPEGGTEVTSGMEVTADTARTLYAHWAFVESLEVTSMSIKARDAGGGKPGVHVGFTATAGTTYVLQQTKELVPADWQTLAEKTPAEDGEASFDEAVPEALATGGFFRVEVKE